MSHTIELRRVSKYYADGDSVSMGFSRVDLDLDIGEFVVITGESGSGKSTLLNVISGLDTYEEGEMYVCGEDTAAYGNEDYEAYRKRYIGNIFQDFNLINSYTVYQNIELVMLISGKKKKECKARIDELIGTVGLEKYRNTKVSKLSGGQKQRVAIARALAKDAPVIVADEPTGNLDSESAATVMETLSRVSKGKLVIIVTHNYEQAEAYATRKLTMNDGKIIEDKRFSEASHDGPSGDSMLYENLAEAFRLRNKKEEPVNPEAPALKKMRRTSVARLGLRNTFNLPAKFILLFIVYLFVSTAVLGQYATTKNSMYETSKMGSNPYFVNESPDRIVIKKADESSFSDADFASVLGIPNIKGIVKNDVALDSGVSISFGDYSLEGQISSVDQISRSELAYGHMPQNDYEIVIRLDSATDAFVTVANNGEEYIDTEALIQDLGRNRVYEFGEDIYIAGIILDKDLDESADFSIYGYSTVYASDEVSKELLISMMADSSATELSYAGTKVINDYGRAVYSSKNVPDGKAYLFENQLYYYNNGEAVGKKVGLKIKNRYFESEGEYTVDKIINRINCFALVELSPDDYDAFYNSVFISENDFRKLFDKGYYQISAFMINEQESDATLQALSEKGFTALALKDSLTDSTGGLGGMLDLLIYARLALEFVVLFMIAYAVIRLIMRSRGSYYSTIRMLGATKSNTSNILRVELVVMMVIAYGADLVFVLLTDKGMLQELTGYEMEEVSKMLYYLDPVDYGVLGAVLLLMSLFIANRYSGHIFSKSAMKTFREGV